MVLNEGMWGAGTFVYNIIFGNMGYEYFSALTIVRSFENMCMVLFVGICGAASVMIGKSVGSGRIGDAMDDSKRFSVIVPLVSVIISCLIAVFRQPLVGIFNMGSNISTVAMETAVSMMLIYACALPFRMFHYLQIVSVFRSGGDTVNGAKMELFCLWAMSVPATLIAIYVFKAPFLAAYAVMFVFEDLPKGCMSIKYYLSKKLIKPVTAEGIAGLERMLEKEQGERINE